MVQVGSLPREHYTKAPSVTSVTTFPPPHTHTGLSNLIFCRAGTVVTEDFPGGLPPCYLDLAFTLGLEYHDAGDTPDGWAGGRSAAELIAIVKEKLERK